MYYIYVGLVGGGGSEKVMNVDNVDVFKACRDGSMKTNDFEKAGAGYDMRESVCIYMRVILYLSRRALTPIYFCCASSMCCRKHR